MFEVTARLKSPRRRTRGFKQQAAEMMRLTRDQDTKTLRYDWFLSEDGTECEVREGYLDADGLVEHAHHIAEATEELFHDFADDHNVTLYGEAVARSGRAGSKLAGVVTFKQFSLLPGPRHRHRGSFPRKPRIGQRTSLEGRYR